MKMGQSLQLRLGQHLSMTPQLQQAIRMLQLSTLELQQEIQEALDSNLMLEVEEDFDQTPSEEPPSFRNESAEEEKKPIADSEKELNSNNDSLPDELPVDTDWDSIYDSSAPPSSGTRTNTDQNTDFLQYTSIEETLADHLMWQLNLSGFNAKELLIGESIVDGINTDGYFKAEISEITAILETQGITEADVEKVLLQIQQDFDPTGVAARDLRECLTIQLTQLPLDIPFRSFSLDLLQHHFAALGRQDQDAIKKALKCNDQELSGITSLIRSLNPRPGTLIASSQPEYITPDVFVIKHKNGWRVELNADITPKVRVNQEYARLIRRADNSDDNQTLKNHLQEARWFIKSVTSRNETLLRVATKIVEFQRAYFDYGEEAMKPLVLRDVAEALELHESTVSRITTRKYMHTPRGTLEFKFFFSSHVGTATGGECSATAIRALIKKLVAGEAARKPLSDNKISLLLMKQGINVARRTVAKYRESMAIAPSNERKRLA